MMIATHKSYALQPCRLRDNVYVRSVHYGWPCLERKGMKQTLHNQTWTTTEMLLVRENEANLRQTLTRTLRQPNQNWINEWKLIYMTHRKLGHKTCACSHCQMDSNALSQDKSTETFTQQYSPRTAYRSVWAEQLSYTPWHSQVLSPWNRQHDIREF